MHGIQTKMKEYQNHRSHKFHHLCCVVITGIQYMQTSSQNQVYNRISNEVCVSLSVSSTDASLADFESFFAPNGTLDAFYNNDLKIFVNNNISLSTGDNAQGTLSNNSLTQLFANIKKIQQAFFK